MLFCVVSLGCACCWKYAGGPYITIVRFSCTAGVCCVLHPVNRAINAPNNIFNVFLISLPLTSNLFPDTEFPKNSIQNLLRGDLSGDLAQCC